MHPSKPLSFLARPVLTAIVCAAVLGIGFSPVYADHDTAKTALKYGNDLFFQQDFIGAETRFAAAVAEDPDWAVAYNNRGLARYKQERLADAEADFTTAIAKDGDYLAPLINRAKCRAAQKRWADALDDLQQGLALCPQHPKLLYNLAWVYDAQGETAAAAETYEAVLVLSPDHLRARIGLAVAYAALGRTDDALAMFYEALNRAERGDFDSLLAAHNLDLLRGPGLSFATQEAADFHTQGVFHLATGQHTACCTALNSALACDRGSAATYWVRYLSYLKRAEERLARICRQQAGTRLERRYVRGFTDGADIFHNGLHQGTAPAMLYLFPGPSDLVLRHLVEGTRYQWAGPLAAGDSAGDLLPLRLNPAAVSAYQAFGPVADSDGDRLADAWEQLWFAGLDQEPADDAPDGDGLADLDEFRSGTSPAAVDTDGDGRSDALESAGGETDPARGNAFFYVNDADTQNDIYCTAPGDDTHDGLSPATPKASLSALLAAVDLPPGAVVRIDTGTYVSTADTVVAAQDGGTALLPVTICGAPGGGTVLRRDGGATGAAVLRLDHTAQVKIVNLVLTGAQDGFGLLDQASQGCRVERCTARGNGTGFYFNGPIRNSLAWDNDTGLDIGPEARVANCTVAQNRQVGIFIRGGHISGSIVTAAGSGAYALYHAEGDLRSDHNDLFVTGGAAVGFSLGRRTCLANWRAATGQDLNSLSEDPLFAEAPQGDFSLQSAGGRYDAAAAAWVADALTSPAVDAGALDADSSGEPLPNGGRTNLGAFGGTGQASKSGPLRRLRLLTPAGGERCAATVPIRFCCTGTAWTATDTLAIYYATQDSPLDWTPIAQGIPYDLGAYLWQAPAEVVAAGQPVWIRLTAESDPALAAAAGSPFYFRDLVLTAPVGGERVSGTLSVTWQTTGAGWTAEDALRLEVSADNGRTWITAAEHLPAAQGSYDWDCTGAVDGPYHRIRLVSERTPDLWAQSARAFYVCNAPLHYYVNDAQTALDAWCTAPGQDLAGNGATPDRPAASVNWIVDTFDLEPGDTVHIDTGTYVLAADIVVTADDAGAENHPVRFEGAPFGVVLNRANPNAGNPAWRIDGASNITITTATSDRHPQAPRKWMAVTGGYSGIDLSVAYHCTLSRLELYGNTHAGIAGNSTLDLACRNNVIHHNARGIYLWGCRTNRLENNTLYQNSTSQIDLEQYSVSNTLGNNIVVARGSGAMGIRVHDKSRDLTFCDYNLIHASQGAIAGHYSGDCATLQAWQAATARDAHSLSNAPGFVDGENGDVHLASSGGSYHGGKWRADDTSAAGIDAGDPAVDVGDEPSDHGNRINLGAYGGTDQASRTPPDRALVLQAPNGGETVNGVCTVRWRSAGRGWAETDTVSVQISSDDGGTWQTVASGIAAADEAWAWDTTAHPSGANYRLRITCDAQPGLAAASEQWFAVTNSRITYYVNDGSIEGDLWCTAPGSDAPQRGTAPASPAASVSWILENYDLEPGDVVQVDTGVYALSENIRITAADQGDATAPVVFEASPYGVTLDRGDRSGGSYAWSIDNADHIVIRTASAETDPERPQTWMRLVNTHIAVNLGYAEDCTVERITAVDCGNIGVNLFRSHSNRVRHCVVYGADNYGIQLWDATENRIENNTMASNRYGGVILTGSAAANELSNNIIYQTGTNRAGIDSRSQQTLAASDYNLVQTENGAVFGLFGVNEFCATLRDWQAKSALDTHSMVADPGFADPGAGDYHLLSTGGRYDGGTWQIDPLSSPALDAGDPAVDPGIEPAANGGRINMGAYGGTAGASKSPAGRGLALRMPRGGDVVEGQYPIAWLSPGQGWEEGDTISIDYSTDNGTTWQPLARAVPARTGAGDMAFKWDTTTLADQPFYRVRITCDQDVAVSDAGAHWFTVHNRPIAYYVNDDDETDDVWCTAPGSDAHDGLAPQRPLCTIQAVIERYDLEPGDTVFIDTGSYPLAADIRITNADEGDTDAPVTFKASAAGVSIQRSGTSGGRCAWIVDDANHVVITTDTTQNGSAWVPMKITGAGTGVFFLNAHNGEVSFLELAGNTSAIGSQSSHNLRMAHNIIHGNQTGIGFNGSNGNIIEQNTVVDNSLVQVNFFYCQSAVMENNILGAGAADSAVFNCNRGDVIQRSDYNLFYTTGNALVAEYLGDDRETLADWQAATGFDAHSLFADPLFVDGAGGDFHLQSRRGSFHGGSWSADSATSPAVDRGDPGTDWGDEPLQNGGRVNLGAYGGTGQASKGIMSVTAPVRYTNTDAVIVSGTRGTGVTLSVATDTAAAPGEIEYAEDGTWQVAIRGLAETANTITIVASDGGGEASTAIVTVVYDITPPSIGVDETESHTNQAPYVVTGTREAGARIEVWGETSGVSADITYPSETTWQASVSGLCQDRNPLTARATDPAGNTASVSAVIVYDTRPPEVTLDPVITPTIEATQVVSGTRETGSDISLAVDTTAQVQALTYPSPVTWTATLQDLATGYNRLTVSAADRAGNLSSASGTILYRSHFYCYGDVDRSDSVDLADAVLALQICGSRPPGTPIFMEGDTDEDGIIDLKDALHVLGIVCGYRSCRYHE